MTVDVRVGIVSWNCANELAACLKALPEALGNLDAEVVVVDNDSNDGSAKVAAASQAVDKVVVMEKNVGYARGMNLALADTEARCVIALNPDTVPAPNSLRQLVSHLDDHASVGLVVPRLTNPDGSVQHTLQPFPSLRVAAVMNMVPPQLFPSWRRAHWLHGQELPHIAGDVDWAIGAVHVIRRAALAGGPYSEDSFIYTEDLDLCHRLHAAGWRVFHRPDVVVQHVGNVSGAQAFGTSREARYWAETYRWTRRTHGSAWTRLYAALNLIGVVVRAAGRRVRGRRVRPGTKVLAATHARNVAGRLPTRGETWDAVIRQ